MNDPSGEAKITETFSGDVIKSKIRKSNFPPLQKSSHALDLPEIQELLGFCLRSRGSELFFQT